MPGDFLIIGGTILAAFVGTIAGFGISTILLPIVAALAGFESALVIVGVVHLASNSSRFWFFRQALSVKLIVAFGVPSMIAAFFGAALATVLALVFLKKIFALGIIAFALAGFFRPRFGLQKTPSMLAGGGIVSGFTAGLIGMGGALRAVFLQAADLPKETYLATTAAVAIAVDTIRVGTYLLGGFAPPQGLFLLLPLLVAAAFFGTWLGQHLVRRIPQKPFRLLVFAFLAIVGIGFFFSA